MSDQQSSYRQIFKATSILGVVQVFNILIGIIRSKVAAIFLGTEGIGILGLFNSTIDLVRSITGLGINTSAVRDISYEAANQDDQGVVKTVTTVRRLCWYTGFLGMITVIVLAPWLSKWTFGNENYTWSFVFLSLIPFFSAISLGQLAVLQGLRKIVYLAKANLYGGLVSLVFLIPLYWWLGVKGIVPLLILAAFVSLIFSYYFARKVAINNVYQTLKETYSRGLGMVKLGVMLTLSSFAGTLVAYALRIYISGKGGLTDVGLYSAAYALMGSYVSLVFTAMGTDFFPRLSAVSDDNKQMEILVNNQAEVGSLILAPMINVFMLFAPYLLMLLYSDKFVPVTTMLQWSMLGVLIQASSWPLAFTLMAKAKNKIFLLKELASCMYYFLWSVLFYNIWGITGLGIGFVTAYVCNIIQISLINKILYNIQLKREYLYVFIPQAVLSVFLFLLIQYSPGSIYMYAIGIVIIVLSVFLSFRELDKRIKIKELIVNRLKNKQ